MYNEIPREVLWKDRTNLDEMLEEPLFKVLHEVFSDFDKEPMLFPLDELGILNEVGYQVTWLCYNSRFGLRPDMEQFEREVFAHTGIMDHAMAVISLVYAVIMMVNFPPLNICNKTKRELSKLHQESWCRRFVDRFVKRVVNGGYIFEEQFLPYQSDYEISMEREEVIMNDWYMCAEPSYEEQQDSKRSFTLDEIVKYAQENLSLDKSAHIQNMLYTLLVIDGTREEREKVASISSYIINRDKPSPTRSEVVLQKHVETEIHNVEAGGTGVNKEYHKE
jgi:hypothetical protein